MKILASILLGSVLIAAAAFAQDTTAAKDDTATAKKTEMHASRHHERYKRDYKTDQAEHQATEDLNKQYRGVNAADAH